MAAVDPAFVVRPSSPLFLAPPSLSLFLVLLLLRGEVGESFEGRANVTAVSLFFFVRLDRREVSISLDPSSKRVEGLRDGRTQSTAVLSETRFCCHDALDDATCPPLNFIDCFQPSVLIKPQALRRLPPMRNERRRDKREELSCTICPRHPSRQHRMEQLDDQS